MAMNYDCKKVCTYTTKKAQIQCYSMHAHFNQAAELCAEVRSTFITHNRSRTRYLQQHFPVILCYAINLILGNIYTLILAFLHPFNLVLDLGLLLLIFIRTRSACNMFHVIMSEQGNNQKHIK